MLLRLPLRLGRRRQTVVWAQVWGGQTCPKGRNCGRLGASGKKWEKVRLAGGKLEKKPQIHPISAHSQPKFAHFPLTRPSLSATRPDCPISPPDCALSCKQLQETVLAKSQIRTRAALTLASLAAAIFSLAPGPEHSRRQPESSNCPKTVARSSLLPANGEWQMANGPPSGPAQRTGRPTYR